MRTNLPTKLEEGRVTSGAYGSEAGDLHGAFLIDGPFGRELKILSSGTDHTYGWEHVSVSLAHHMTTPVWEEMCFVKEQFWTDEECVMQLHPPKADYVNNHPGVLHLWRPLRTHIPMPKKIQV